jgi:hypothetical protein
MFLWSDDVQDGNGRSALYPPDDLAEVNLFQERPPHLRRAYTTVSPIRTRTRISSSLIAYTPPVCFLEVGPLIAWANLT